MKKTKQKTVAAALRAPTDRQSQTAATNASGAATGELRRVPLKLIDPSPYQARKTFQKSKDWPEFVASVRQHGVVQAGLGRELPNGRIELVFGERRFRASEESGHPDLPLVIRPITDQEAQDYVAIENLQREGLNEIEEAQGYAEWITRLTSNGEAGPAQCATRKEAIEYISARIHRTRSVIYERLRLTELTPAEAELLTSGKISASVASLLPTIPDAKDRKEFAEELERMSDQGYPQSVRQVEEDIEDRFCKPLRDVSFDPKKEYVLPSQNVIAAGFHDRVDTLPTCGECPYRSGNMLDQFPAMKSRPNVCTNPKCFKAKEQAAIELELEQAAAQGKKTMTEKEFKKQRDEFVRADEFVYAKNKQGDWSTLMGKHKPEPVIVATKDGLRTVYPKAEALEACKKNKVEFRKESREQTPAEREKAEAEKKSAIERRNKVAAAAVPIVAKALSNITEKRAWEMVVQHFVEGRGGKGEFKGKTPMEQTLAYIFNCARPVYYDGDWNDGALKLYKSMGVDLKAEEKKLLAEEAKKAKAPEEFAKEMLGLAKAAGFKPLVEQFKAISDMARRAGLKDINECETEADRHNLIEQFKTDFPACIKGKNNPAKAAKEAKKTTKTKPAQAGKKGQKK